MEVLGEDQALQAVLGRGNEALHAMDNETSLDFTQLEDYLNNDSDHFNFESIADHQDPAPELHSSHGNRSHPSNNEYNEALSFKNTIHYTKGPLPDSPPESEPYSPPEETKPTTLCSFSSNVPPANYSQISIYDHLKQMFGSGQLNNAAAAQAQTAQHTLHSPQHGTAAPTAVHRVGTGHTTVTTQHTPTGQTVAQPSPSHGANAQHLSTGQHTNTQQHSHNAQRSPVHNNLQSPPSTSQQTPQQQLLHYMKSTNQLNAATLQQHLNLNVAVSRSAPVTPQHLNNQTTTSPQHAPPAHAQPVSYVSNNATPAGNLLQMTAHNGSDATSTGGTHSAGQIITPNTTGHTTAAKLPPTFGVMNNLSNHPNKKRKYESPNNTVNAKNANSILNGLLANIKQEPDMSPQHSNNMQPSPSTDDSNLYDYDSSILNEAAYLDSAYQCIKYQPWQPSKWHTVCDINCKDLPVPSYRIDADKGFNFSVADDAFVCQKKNHFQVTCHIGLCGDPRFVKTTDGLRKIDSWYLHFFGCKMESMSQTIKVEQSQSDRSKRAFHPVLLQLQPDQLSKVTVGRLHFSETTTNNMRKKGKPNPDQRFFLLVVGLFAHCGTETFMVVAQASERIIVRASNPGQFENDVDVTWQKGQNQDSIWHSGRVGINSDRPDEALVVHGNLKVTGQVMQPSDMRVKENISEVDTRNHLQNVLKLKLYKYRYSENFAQTAGMSDDELDDCGVLAQELREVIPDAVKETDNVVLPNGETIEKFLVVNKDRVFMENLGAVKELCKLTDNLENRIDELEIVNQKLSKLKRVDSLKSNASSTTTLSRSSTIRRSKDNNKTSRGKSRNSSQHQRNAQPPAGMCSSRLVQITIIVLVMIMAFCLIAMATLYILEWHERQSPTAVASNMTLSVITGHKQTQSTLPPDKSTASTTSTLPLTPIPGHSPPLLIPHYCQLPRTTCHVSPCCYVQEPKPTELIIPHNKTQAQVPQDHPLQVVPFTANLPLNTPPCENCASPPDIRTPRKQKDGTDSLDFIGPTQWSHDIDGSTETEDLLTEGALHPSKVIMPPDIPQGPSFPYNPEISEGGGGVFIHHNHLPGANHGQEIHVHPPVVGTEEPSNPQHLGDGDQAVMQRHLPSSSASSPLTRSHQQHDAVVVVPTDPGWKKYRIKKYKRFVELRKKRDTENLANQESAEAGESGDAANLGMRSAIPLEPAVSDVPQTTISIVNMIEVTDIYCLNRDCGQPENSSYYIPISPYMHSNPITINITVPTGFDVHLCGFQVEGSICADTGFPEQTIDTPVIEKGHNSVSHQWMIPATQYPSSSFTFRVAPDNLVLAQVCADTAGTDIDPVVTFFQNNLYFYRVCTTEGTSSTTPFSNKW